MKKVYTSGTATLTVQMDASKKGGSNLKVSVRKPGEKTETGLRSTVDDQAEAAERFKALCADAVKQGWTAQEAAKSDRYFSEMPAAPTANGKKKK